MDANLIILITAIIYYIVNVIYDLFFANGIQLKKSNSNEIDLSHFNTEPISGIHDIKAKIVKSSGKETINNSIDHSIQSSDSSKVQSEKVFSKSEQSGSMENISNIDNKNKPERNLEEEQPDIATGIAYEVIEVDDNSLTLNNLEEQQDFIVSETNLLTYTNLKRKAG